MKKTRFTGYSVALILLATFVLFGCGKGDVSGTYQLENSPNRELILYNNGKGLLYDTRFDYSVKDDTIMIIASEGSVNGTVSRKALKFEPSKDTFTSFFTGKWKKK